MFIVGNFSARQFFAGMAVEAARQMHPGVVRVGIPDYYTSSRCSVTVDVLAPEHALGVLARALKAQIDRPWWRRDYGQMGVWRSGDRVVMENRYVPFIGHPWETFTWVFGSEEARTLWAAYEAAEATLADLRDLDDEC